MTAEIPGARTTNQGITPEQAAIVEGLCSRAAPVPQKAISEMTPAEIYAKHGSDVADHILKLSASVSLWKRIACDRLKVNSELMP